MAVVKPPDTPQRASDAKTAKPQSFQKTPPDWWGPEWSVVWATLILAMVGAFQLAMFFVQLRYMRKGINDANAASEVARKAAEAAYLSASAGIEANKISQELFVSGERPWISANVTPASDLTVTPDGRCILHIRTTLKNHGKSPALSVKYVVGFVEYNLERAMAAQDEMREYLSISMARPSDADRYGFALFPLEEINFVEQVVPWVWDKPGSASRQPPTTKNTFDERFILRFVVGFVDYAFTVGGGGQTAFVYNLTKNAPSRMLLFDVGGGAIERTDMRIPMDAVVLHRMSVGNHAK